MYKIVQTTYLLFYLFFVFCLILLIILFFFIYFSYILLFGVHSFIICNCSVPSQLRANSRNYEKDNPRGSQVIAAVAKVSCNHGLWLVARVKKRAHIFVFDMCSLFSLSMLYYIFNFLNASLFSTVCLLHRY